MRSVLRLLGFLFLFACSAARAQDVPGIELCTHEARMDRRTGCLQSNIEYLHALITKNAAAAQQKANTAAGEIAALKAEVTALRTTLSALQARLERLEAAAKARPAAPPEKPATKR
jgi:endonuclease/exonuclease/phosphatase (EEP) superfamily protein YafD